MDKIQDPLKKGTTKMLPMHMDGSGCRRPATVGKEGLLAKPYNV